MTYYGTFHTLKEIKDAICFLEDHDWDKDIFNEKYLKNAQRRKYIRQIGDTYMVQKNINGHLYSFGTFRRLEDALHERDVCVECDWDYDLIVEK